MARTYRIECRDDLKKVKEKYLVHDKRKNEYRGFDTLKDAYAFSYRKLTERYEDRRNRNISGLLELINVKDCLENPPQYHYNERAGQFGWYDGHPTLYYPRKVYRIYSNGRSKLQS